MADLQTDILYSYAAISGVRAVSCAISVTDLKIGICSHWLKYFPQLYMTLLDNYTRKVLLLRLSKLVHLEHLKGSSSETCNNIL